MSTDPYHAVKAEIETSLQAAGTLRASYLRIRSTASEGSEELDWARNELKATLAALDADLEDLEESVRIVEETGGRLFGLEEREVAERRKYVGQVRKAVENMRQEVSGVPALSSMPSIRKGPDTPAPEPSDDQAQWSREEQQASSLFGIDWLSLTLHPQMLMQQQDHTLTSISGTLSTLAEQAGLMGQEVGEHNEMLHDLEGNVDRTETKLGDAMKKMKKFIRDTEETKSGWCIGILIVILCILLVLVVLL
ncbi:t-SNARE [Gautieria morchelliformis]|nr:t-SNARE [Gautieria morchelliformis]